MRKLLAVSSAVSAVLVSGSVFAQATTTDIGTLFGGVDISDVKTQVLTVGAVIISIALVMKGISLVKKTIGKI